LLSHSEKNAKFKIYINVFKMKLKIERRCKYYTAQAIVSFSEFIKFKQIFFKMQTKMMKDPL